MSLAAQAFDLGLALAIVWTALMAMRGHGLLRSIVFYVSAGLLMSLAWVRMDAPDLGLAEAAVGAGITGVLLLDTLGRIGGRRQAEDRHG